MAATSRAQGKDENSLSLLIEENRSLVETNKRLMAEIVHLSMQLSKATEKVRQYERWKQVELPKILEENNTSSSSSWRNSLSTLQNIEYLGLQKSGIDASNEQGVSTRTALDPWQRQLQEVMEELTVKGERQKSQLGIGDIPPPLRSVTNRPLSPRKPSSFADSCKDLYDEKKIILVQAVARSWLTRKHIQMCRKADMTMGELISTEKSYCVSLQTAYFKFMKPMMKLAKTSKMVTEANVKCIFSELQVIMLYAESFLAELEHRSLINDSQPRDSYQYGDIFSTMSFFCRSYVQYVNNYNASLTCLYQLRQKHDFALWLQKQERAAGKDTIESYLIQPVQRIPRYVLLLKEIVKNTPPSNADSAALQKALSMMKSLALDINESKREAEAMHDLLKIYKMLQPQPKDFIQPFRKFLRKGTIYYFAKEGEEPKKKYLLLFNDVMLLTKKMSPRKHLADTGKGTTTSVYRLELLANLKNATSVVSLADTDVVKHCFILDTPKKTLMFHAETEEEKKEWVTALSNCIERISARSTVFPQLDDNVPQ